MPKFFEILTMTPSTCQILHQLLFPGFPSIRRIGRGEPHPTSGDARRLRRKVLLRRKSGDRVRISGKDLGEDLGDD
jgi:hypothetical protein